MDKPITTNGGTRLADDLIAVWRGMPHLGIFGILLAAWVAMFHFVGNSTLGYIRTPSLFGWLYWVLTRGMTDGMLATEVHFTKLLDSEEAHVWLLPVVILILFWWKRNELMATPTRTWWPALVVLVG